MNPMSADQALVRRPHRFKGQGGMDALSPTGKRRKRPLGVTLLAILQILSGLQLLLSTLIYLVLSSWAETPEGVTEISRTGSDWIVQNASGAFFLFALVSFILGVCSLLLARGYVLGFERARRNGRRVAAFAILFALFAAIFLPQRVDAGSPLWTIVFNVVVIIYLGSAKVRSYFG